MDLRAFIESRHLSEANASENPFWARLNANIKSDIERILDRGPLDDRGLAEIIQLVNNRPFTSYLQESATVGEVKEIIASADRKSVLDVIADLLQAWRNRIVDRKSKDEQELRMALDFLRKEELLDEYEEFLAARNIRPRYVNARHFFYAQQIRSYLPNKPEIHVLEIGGGDTVLANFIRCLGDGKMTYTDVDLPEMLIVAAATTQGWFPQIEVFFYESGTLDDVRRPGRFVLVPAQLFDELKRGPHRFDLIVNTNSFQEMDRDVRDDYVQACDRLLAPGGIFFNVNWIQKRMDNKDGSLYENNPLTYPYCREHEILFFNVDPFMEHLRIKFGYKNTSSLAITSVRRKAISASA
jgi:putative sugar O-methyltransferase